MKNVIEIKELTFAYEKTPVLENVSFDIAEGTLTAILGANGSGKSTLLDCLAGLQKPQRGEVLLFGKPVGEYTNREFAKRVAYISQSSSINIDYSIREFILFGRNPFLGFGGFPKERDYEKCEKHSKTLGITHLLDKSVTKVSGGERQMAFLCRALVQESDILVFDEPLAALDFGNQNKVLMLFLDFVSQGKTVIFTTHNPNQVLDLDCNVMVVNDHRVVCAGVASETIDQALLEQIYPGGIAKASMHYTFDINRHER